MVAYLDGTSTEIDAATTEYESNIADKDLAMPNAVGGIAKGTKISALEGKTYNEMFDDPLVPNSQPYIYCSFCKHQGGTDMRLQEVGATGPADTNFHCRIFCWTNHTQRF